MTGEACDAMNININVNINVGRRFKGKEKKKRMFARIVILVVPLNQAFCYGVRFIAMRTSNGWVTVTFIVKKNNTMEGTKVGATYNYK